MTYTDTDFKHMTGRDSSYGDLERVNCDKAGDTGHRQCGVCPEHDKPRFVCGCLAGYVFPKGTKP